ncbi:MAG: transporter [Acidimicrobiales bacterium]|nr:transporter [Acidimicrobiales bacterium]
MRVTVADDPAPSSVGAVPAAAGDTTVGRGISSRLTMVLAVAAGLTVANLYYVQPLLHTIGADLGASNGATGLLVTASQIGYALGLALVVPIGDLVDRRRLTTWLLGLTTVMLAGASVAPVLWVLVALLGLAGLGSVTAQVLIALAAGLAADGDRGRVVSTVMTGLLLGILLARTVSGAVADLANWRVVYALAAVVAVGLGVVLRRELPPDPPRTHVAYRKLLASVLQLLRDQPELRRSAALGAIGFATFSVFWTTIAFHLGEAPFGYGDGAIGLLGLAGAAGALCALAAGRLADRGLAKPARVAMAVVVAASFGALWLGRGSIVAIVLGVLLLDIGVQGVQVLNQTVIYELAPEARSRITSAYMTLYFAGGALGSAAGAVAYDAGGWARVCQLGAALGTAAVLVAIPGARRTSQS